MTRIASVAIAAVLVAALHASAVAGPSRKVARLHVGGSVFWDGDHIATAEDPLPVPLPSLLDKDGEGCDNDCFEYEIELAERGARLRVAIDTPDCDSSFDLELVDPRGELRARDTSCYSAELYTRDPVPGTWIARVTPLTAGDAVFRMRAKLEAAATEPRRRRRLLPNLRVEAPHGFGFNTGNGGLTATSQSCYQDEVIEDGAVRCLRFSVGPQNAGAGPLELKFARSTEVDTEASMYQRIYYSDGTTKMRDAGKSEFHKAHQHFHLKGFANFGLFRVKDRSQGTLVKAGTGHKSGFCLVDLRIAKWRRFDQQRAYSARSNCMPVGGRAELGLSAGWTDVYGSELSGNYVEFGNNPDGYYLVRVTVDSHRHILESNERDNVGYAYLNIRGDSVTVIERGRGTSPWDPNKIVFRSWWNN